MTDENLPAKTSRRVLLTGATGFLGHHTAHALVARGYEVVALCRDPQSAAARRLPASVQRLHGDILDADAVGSAALGCDAVIHCAGKVSRDPEDALLMTRINHDGMITVYKRLSYKSAEKRGTLFRGMALMALQQQQIQRNLEGGEDASS